MSIKHIDDLDQVTSVDNNHTILVYQDNRLKKINSEELFYSKDYIENNIDKYRRDIIESLNKLNIDTPEDTSLTNLISYISKLDLFEIGVRRIVHDGTDTRYPTDDQPASYTSMGNPQLSWKLDRCYKIGEKLTVISGSYLNPNPNKDFIYAAEPYQTSITRNDFHGGEYASDQWKSGIYPWNSMERVQDSDGNYFTKVPLYYIKEEFITDNGIDITASYPKIPDKYINNTVYKYTFVSKSRLKGYRPAEFFYKYVYNIMKEDDNGDYIYLDDLECYTIPTSYGTNKRYRLSDELNDITYTKILTRYHYFSCYEAAEEVINGKPVIVSKPGLTPLTGLTLEEFRQRCRENSFYVRDIRSYTDFFCTLMSIEFASTWSDNLTFNGVNTSNLLLFINETGTCDNSNRTYNNRDTKTFKWNWIENPYGNTVKVIDGVRILCRKNDNGLYENRIYVSNIPNEYSNTIESSYYNIIRYIMPSEYIDSYYDDRMHASGTVVQLGYDPIYPWCQLVCKCGDVETGYHDWYSESSCEKLDTDVNYDKLLTIGMTSATTFSARCGLYSIDIRRSIDYTEEGIGIGFEKEGE